MTAAPNLTWLATGEAFPCVDLAWGPASDAPGLLASGGALDVATLTRSYAQGIFPWYSAGQPVLWWSPEPRMVLPPGQFQLHHSLRKRLNQFIKTPGCDIRFDSAFSQVIAHCAQTPRAGQTGSWIVPEMVQAYTALHQAGHAHSVETWVDGELVGGLYCVNLGGMVFGESMFSLRTDASKIALAALVAFCCAQGIELIDCQQNTQHLASMGAREMPRAEFISKVSEYSAQPKPQWHFEHRFWERILSPLPAGAG